MPDSLKDLKQKMCDLAKNPDFSYDSIFKAASTPTQRYHIHTQRAEIGKLAYQYFLEAKETAKRTLSAQRYFILAYILQNPDAIKFLQLANSKLVKTTIGDSLKDSSSDKLFNQGMTHLLGLVVTRNVSNGLPLIEGAAEKGNKIAQFFLAQLHEEGHIIPQDQSRAIKWYIQAANNGLIEAKCRLAAIYFSRNDMPAYQTYINECAQQGDLRAHYEIAEQHFLAGRVKEARTHYIIAANGGHLRAAHSLGLLYSNDCKNIDIPTKYVNPTLATEWFLRAARQDHLPSQIAWVNIYIIRNSKATVTAEEMSQGYSWLEKAANNGDAESAYFCGKLCLIGGLPYLNEDKALQWFIKADDLSFSGIGNKIAKLYLKKGCIDQAFRIYRKEIEAGYGDDLDFMLKTNLYGDYIDYHTMMHDNNFKSVVPLLVNDSKMVLINELIWDMERAVSGSPLDNLIEKILINKKLLTLVVLKLHKMMLSAQNEKERIKYYNLLSTYVNKLPYAEIEIDQPNVLNLITCLTDVWFNSQKEEDYQGITDSIAIALKILCLRLATFDNSQIQERQVILLAATIIIKSNFGSQFEVSFVDCDLATLIAFLVYRKQNPEQDYHKINDKLGVKFIRDKSDCKSYTELLDKLYQYSTQAPELHNLQLFLDEKWIKHNPKGTKEAQKVMAQIIEYVGDYATMIKTRPQSFFRFNDPDARMLFKLLGDENILELSSFLDKKLIANHLLSSEESNNVTPFVRKA